MTIPIRPLGFIDEIQLTTGWLFEFSVLRQNPQIRLLLSLLIRLAPKSPWFDLLCGILGLQLTIQGT